MDARGFEKVIGREESDQRCGLRVAHRRVGGTVSREGDVRTGEPRRDEERDRGDEVSRGDKVRHEFKSEHAV